MYMTTATIHPLQNQGFDSIQRNQEAIKAQQNCSGSDCCSILINTIAAVIAVSLIFFAFTTLNLVPAILVTVLVVGGAALFFGNARFFIPVGIPSWGHTTTFIPVNTVPPRFTPSNRWQFVPTGPNVAPTGGGAPLHATFGNRGYTPGRAAAPTPFSPTGGAGQGPNFAFGSRI